MDNEAFKIVRGYIQDQMRFQMTLPGETIENSQDLPEFNLFIVWKAKIIQNWKYIIASDLPDNKMYEVTYNGDKDEWYLDEYDKVNNVVAVKENKDEVLDVPGDDTSTDVRGEVQLPTD